MILNKCKLSGMSFWYKKDDRFVGQRVAEGKYERYETKLLLGQINKDSVVVDVGANIGYYTIQMAQKAKKVYAFEPDKENFDILTKNVKNNKLDNVVLINAAVGSKKEKIKLYKSAENDGDHRVYPSATVRISSDVICLRLDDILKYEQKIALIKIDTQGWEPEVIKGVNAIIKRDSPTMFLEYWPSAYKQAKLDAKKMMVFLKKNYKYTWQIDSDLNIIRKNIKINHETGYADLWVSNKYINVVDRFGSLKIKKLIKQLFKVK